MARTIAVVREGLQRSLVRIFQVLRVATARSQRQRTGVGLVHGLLPARQLRPVAVPLERGTHGTAGALIRLVRKGHHVSVGQRGDDAVGSRSSQVVRRAGTCRRRPDEASGRIRDYLHVHPMPSVLSGVVRLLIVHAVDRDQRALEDT
jgi:hypothetical protein